MSTRTQGGGAEGPVARDIPIIFSAPMIQALLAGWKTQTRRLAWRDARVVTSRTVDGVQTGLVVPPGLGGDPARLPSPWRSVRPGDRLWVRETFSYAHAVKDDPKRRHMVSLWYWADGQPGHGDFSRPKPSIHMPRWASRLTLLVSDVRVQRLQHISDADIAAEGLAAAEMARAHSVTMCPRRSFGNLWNSLHGDGAWEANPEVVALSFTVHHGNIDAMEAAHG